MKLYRIFKLNIENVCLNENSKFLMLKLHKTCQVRIIFLNCCISVYLANTRSYTHLSDFHKAKEICKHNSILATVRRCKRFIIALSTVETTILFAYIRRQLVATPLNKMNDAANLTLMTSSKLETLFERRYL